MLRLIVASALTLVVAAGCGGGASKKVPVHPVGGKVTLLNAPLTGAMVTFGPKEGQPLAYGMTNDQGEYALTTYTEGDGAAVGTYSVVVQKFAAASAQASAPKLSHGTEAGVNYGSSGSHAGGKSKAASGAGSIIPPQYSDGTKTPLSFKVEAKSNRYDIEIK